MTARNQIDLLLLAALWGASFLFMRVAVPILGPLALIELRVVVAAAFLLPILAWRGQLLVLISHWRPLAVVGMLNSALPFVLIAYATLSLTAGFASVINATTPMFGALVAWFWLSERLNWLKVLGLVIGFAGVAILVWDKVSFKTGTTGLAVMAALLATFAYGVAASYTKRYLHEVVPLAIAAGSQLWAGIVLLPFAVWQWPVGDIPVSIWLNVLVLGIACTGLAYILYFRLLAELGATRATAVTFLIPVFGVVWGAVWLGETVTLRMLAGGVVILLGTALTMDVWSLKRRTP
ncbi:DMT family transporter [Chitinivorax sp. B]|uniref:DMT family transporter n=1 Tax=Chitinivorax sp. B TaxID=2502235 RepID=UPI0010F56FE8|nr:DMT family transporter [Chitinivorax sp. B]